jgi:hypothetical protein
MMAYSVVFIIGGTILCLYWWGINRALLAAREITSKPAATSQVADAVPPVATPTDSSRISPASIVRPAIIQLRPAPRKPHEIPSPYTQKSSPNREDALKNAQEAAEHYRDTSQALSREQIRKGYSKFLNKIVSKFSSQVDRGEDWYNKESQLYRTLTTVLDWEESPSELAEQQFPGASWAGIRVMVRFETVGNSRLMRESYVIVGRTPDDREVVGLLTYGLKPSGSADKYWSLLSDGTDNADHEKIMSETVQSELDRLTEEITSDIKSLQ